MFLFLALLALVSVFHPLNRAPFFAHAEFWIYPLQTILCTVLLIYFRRFYPIDRPRRVLFTILAAVLVFLIWITPQQFLGFSARLDGFNPQLLADQPLLYRAELIFRLLRLVLVVPLVEEVFWRSFLLRFLIKEDFPRVPFGQFRWLSFSVVAVAFCFSHSRPDWPAALITGAVYNFVAWRTGSLTSCVLAHAVTNMLLGIWILHTEQWGFW